MKSFKEFKQVDEATSWQDTSHVVAKSSAKQQANYFQKFPERKEFFQKKHPDMAHFTSGMSVKKASMGVKADATKKAEAEKKSLSAYGATRGVATGDTQTTHAAPRPVSPTPAKSATTAPTKTPMTSAERLKMIASKFQKSTKQKDVQRSFKQKASGQVPTLSHGGYEDRYDEPMGFRHYNEEVIKESEEHPELKKIRDEYEKYEGKGTFDHSPHVYSDDNRVWERGDNLKTKYEQKRHELKQKGEIKEDLDRKFPAEGSKVKVIGDVQHKGKTGTHVSSNKDGSFHVINIGGKHHSFHGSDLKSMDEEVVNEANKENKQKKNAYVANIIKSKLHPSVLPSLAYGRKALKTEETVTEGFIDHEEIAKELVKRHGKNVTKKHIDDIQSELDTNRSLDHDEVMSHVKKMNESATQFLYHLKAAEKSSNPKSKIEHLKKAQNARYSMSTVEIVKHKALLDKHRVMMKEEETMSKMSYSEWRNKTLGIKEGYYKNMETEKQETERLKKEHEKKETPAKEKKEDMKEAYDVDHMPGKHVRGTLPKDCPTCNGRKFMYVKPDGTKHADKKTEDSKRVACDSCSGKGWVKEEVEQIDEISKETAGNYAQAAMQDQIKKKGLKGALKDTTSKRAVGISRALDRVTKEEVKHVEESSAQADMNKLRKGFEAQHAGKVASWKNPEELKAAKAKNPKMSLTNLYKKIGRKAWKE